MKYTGSEEELVRIAATVEAENPGLFVSRAHLVNRIAKETGATGQAVRRWLVRMCSDGLLVEVRPECDWKVRLPGSNHLPDLYAWQTGDAYELRIQRPKRSSSGPTSFFVTPEGLRRLRISLTRKHGKRGEGSVTVDSFLDAVRSITDTAVTDGAKALDVIRWMPDLLRHRQADEMRQNPDLAPHADKFDPFVWDVSRYRRKADDQVVPPHLFTLWV